MHVSKESDLELTRQYRVASILKGPAFVANPVLVSDKPKVNINGKPINILKNLDDFDKLIVA